ncbi:PepSY-like domain-containing protein [Cytophagaceae bacterium ABcell3]|nr:PepSY-like domain-containing protein [Cytophagaceae bacterium ABcell3]
MKKLILVLTAGALAFTGCNRGGLQQAEVPAEVVTSFNQRYPEATDVEWREDNGNYEVEFEYNDTEMEAVYHPDGTLRSVEEEEGIFGGLEPEEEEEAEIPEEVIQNFNQRYPEAENVEWEEDNGDYVVEFEEDGMDLEATYREDGTLKRIDRR